MYLSRILESITFCLKIIYTNEIFFEINYFHDILQMIIT